MFELNPEAMYTVGCFMTIFRPPLLQFIAVIEKRSHHQGIAFSIFSLYYKGEMVVPYLQRHGSNYKLLHIPPRPI